MSWQLASFVVLAVALAGGFAWYERSHPSSRVLALVATLAALAALGRIAFAPLPNVKPTTDIVLIAGAALGGAPGFAVGALAALTSNLFFGQGPWTPWQMAAWGGVGIAGAVLGRVAGERLGRVPLAAACAVAGLAFGAVMNLSTWITYADGRSAGSYVAIAGSALPFDLAHAVGNFLFALAFGPALLRMVGRFRRRFEVTWQPVPAATATLVLLALAAGLVVPAAGAATPAAYLARAQNSDGGWGAAPGQRSSPLYTGWTALGVAAAGRNPLDVRRGGSSAIDYIRANPPALGDTGSIERTILVLRAAGVSPRLAGRDLVAALARRQRRDGSIDGQVNLTAFGVLALRSAGRSPSSSAVAAAGRWLARQQNVDGGFGFFRRGGQSDVDDTGAAVEALAAAGKSRSRTVSRAVGHIARAQGLDGGLPSEIGEPSNAQSTAFAVQGLLAAGRDPDRVRRGGSRSPLGYLRTLTAPDGSVRYSRTSDQTPVWVTAQALAALARRPLPLAPVPRARHGLIAGAAAGGKTAPGARRAGTSSAPAVTPLGFLVAAHELGLAMGWLMPLR